MSAQQERPRPVGTFPPGRTPPTDPRVNALRAAALSRSGAQAPQGATRSLLRQVPREARARTRRRRRRTDGQAAAALREPRRPAKNCRRAPHQGPGTPAAGRAWRKSRSTRTSPRRRANSSRYCGRTLTGKACPKPAAPPRGPGARTPGRLRTPTADTRRPRRPRGRGGAGTGDAGGGNGTWERRTPQIPDRAKPQNSTVRRPARVTAARAVTRR
jgi:hypothetical protein